MPAVIASELLVSGVIVDTGIEPANSANITDSAGLGNAPLQAGLVTDERFTGFFDETELIDALLSALDGITDLIRVSHLGKDTGFCDDSVLIPDTISYLTPVLTPTGSGTLIETAIATRSTETEAGGIKPWVIGVAAAAAFLILIAIVIFVVCLVYHMRDDGEESDREPVETNVAGIQFVDAVPKAKPDTGGFSSNVTVENPLFHGPEASTLASAVYQDEEVYDGDVDEDFGAMVV